MEISKRKREKIIEFYQDIHDMDYREAEELFEEHYKKEENRYAKIKQYALHYRLEFWEAEDMYRFNEERGLL